MKINPTDKVTDQFFIEQHKMDTMAHFKMKTGCGNVFVYQYICIHVIFLLFINIFFIFYEFILQKPIIH